LGGTKKSTIGIEPPLMLKLKLKSNDKEYKFNKIINDSIREKFLRGRLKSFKHLNLN
jgi:hypothetical protein